MNKFLNVELTFPVLSIIKNEFLVINTLEKFTTCKRSMIQEIKRMDEYVLDTSGNFYKTIDVEYVKYLNFFGGFSLAFAGFGVCRVKKSLQFIKVVPFDELKQLSSDFLGFYKRIGAGSNEDFLVIKKKINDARTSKDLLDIIFKSLR